MGMGDRASKRHASTFLRERRLCGFHAMSDSGQIVRSRTKSGGPGPARYSRQGASRNRQRRTVRPQFTPAPPRARGRNGRRGGLSLPPYGRRADRAARSGEPPFSRCPGARSRRRSGGTAERTRPGDHLVQCRRGSASFHRAVLRSDPLISIAGHGQRSSRRADPDPQGAAAGRTVPRRIRRRRQPVAAQAGDARGGGRRGPRPLPPHPSADRRAGGRRSADSRRICLAGRRLRHAQGPLLELS